MIDFHNHTARCGHANGTPQEYVEAAIENGITILGFSDHAPLPAHLREGVSMKPDEVSPYMKDILTLKEQYKEQIEIRLGFELDFPIRDSFDKALLHHTEIDYFIGSVHYIEDWPVDNSAFLDGYKKIGVDNVYRIYYEKLLKLASSGLVDIIAHFDLVKKYGFRPLENFSNQIQKIAQAAVESNTAIEINSAGLRKPVKEQYPSEEIVAILAKEGVSFTLGSDSHSPSDVGYAMEESIALLKRHGVSKVSTFKNRKRSEITI